jgi:signal transduction histidine kinase
MIDLAFGKGSQADIDEIRDLVGLARREAVDAIAVIEDLLTASRMENDVLDMTPERIEIDLELSKIVDHYPTEGLSVELVNPHSGLVAWADQVRVRQVLRNLLSNAVRYGGNAISIGVQASDTLVRIQVCDDGGGVPTGEEETIFLAYRRATATRRHQSSVGLGLWISRRLARSMDGDLTYGRSGELTVFELSLPVFMPSPSASPTAGPAGAFDREGI